MRKILSAAAIVVFVITAMVAHAGVASAGSAQTTVIAVSGGTGAIQLGQDTARAGRIRFDVTASTGQTGPLLFKLKPGVTLDEFFSAAAELSFEDPAVAAQGTRDMTAAALYYGLADVAAGTPASVTDRLSAGTYYLIDLEAPPTASPQLTTLRVHGALDRRHQGEDNRAP